MTVKPSNYVETHFPEASNLLYGGYKITMRKVVYDKHGSRWKETSTETQDVSGEFYYNCLSAIPFFKDRVEQAYTYAGYIPVKLVCYSPNKMIKIVHEFNIDLIN